MPQPQIISENVSKGGQSVDYVLIENVQVAQGTGILPRQFKLKFEVRSDSIKAQCHALVSIWSDAALQWNRIHSMHHADMKTVEKLAYIPRPVTVEHFAADTAELRRIAIGILSK